MFKPKYRKDARRSKSMHMQKSYGEDATNVNNDIVFGANVVHTKEAIEMGVNKQVLRTNFRFLHLVLALPNFVKGKNQYTLSPWAATYFL